MGTPSTALTLGTVAGLGLVYGAGAGTVLGLILAGGPGLALGGAIGAGIGLVAGAALERWSSRSLSEPAR